MMACNSRARRLVLLNLALLAGLGPFIMVESVHSSSHASPNGLETSSLNGEQDNGLGIATEKVRIDAFDMEICGKANFKPWQEEQSAFGYAGQSHELEQEQVGERGQVATRIIGGEFAQEGEFPSYVHINKTGEFNCGATLIHRDLVVTAAHCLDNPGERTLIFGSNWLNGTGGEIREVERWCYMSNFSRTKRGIPLNDLAVIRFKANIVYTPTISPACLHLDSRPSEETICTIVGLGDDETESSPSRLKTLSVERSCKEKFIGQSCYLTAENGRQLTQSGDSGSPVICYDRSSRQVSSDQGVRAYVVGANSWGRGRIGPKPELLANYVADFHHLKPNFLELLEAIRREGNETSGGVICKVPIT